MVKTSKIEKNDFLEKDILAFYHADYHSRGNWRVEGTIENIIWTLKNDAFPFPERLENAKSRLKKILLLDLPIILKESGKNQLTVCIIPRAKREDYYRQDQLYFKQVVNETIEELKNKNYNFENGVDYIKRHTNTRTTHTTSYGQDGPSPYKGITRDTCTISDKVVDKDILLIDDVYTASINIAEDAIQTLIDKGARSVIFYAIGRTIKRF